MEASVCEKNDQIIKVENDSNRYVKIDYSADPHISVVEEVSTGVRPLMSIEIKGGADISNVHNRIGEAEKSHQKARQLEFFEFWTILRAEVNPLMARRESPTTSRFFNLDRISNSESEDFYRFRALLSSIIGIGN